MERFLQNRTLSLQTHLPPGAAARGEKRQRQTQRLQRPPQQKGAGLRPPSASHAHFSPAPADPRGGAAAPARRPSPSSSSAAAPLAPLAERMRPADLDSFIGQDDVVGEGSILRDVFSALFAPAEAAEAPAGADWSAAASPGAAPHSSLSAAPACPSAEVVDLVSDSDNDDDDVKKTASPPRGGDTAAAAPLPAPPPPPGAPPPGAASPRPPRAETLISLAKRLPSVIFWGPPGCGKTSLCRILVDGLQAVSRYYVQSHSAVHSGVADLKRCGEEALARRRLGLQQTVLFVDEIHRFNKAQQDCLLPFVESGLVTLLGATTENPSFEIIAPLLSRCRVFRMRQLETAEVKCVLTNAMRDNERGLGRLLPAENVDDDALDWIAASADGDARRALNALEMLVPFCCSGGGAGAAAAAVAGGPRRLTREFVQQAMAKSHLVYDKKGDSHYNLISALHKSVRGSDVGASLYYLGRMLYSGEDVLYVARRVVRMASEDIGLADPHALPLAVAAYQACHFVGMPEADCILAEAVAYLARAHKSNSVYTAMSRVRECISARSNLPPPLHILNAPTRLMKEMGFGRGYLYNHDFEGPVNQTYLPDELQGTRFFYDAPKRRRTDSEQQPAAAAGPGPDAPPTGPAPGPALSVGTASVGAASVSSAASAAESMAGCTPGS